MSTNEGDADRVLAALARFKRECPPFEKQCVLLCDESARVLRAMIPDVDLVYTLHAVPDWAVPRTFFAMQMFGGHQEQCPLCTRDTAELVIAEERAATSQTEATGGNRHLHTAHGE